MTVIDLALAVAGRSHAVASRGGRSTGRARLLVAALFVLTAIPIVIIALSPIPLERTFEELRDGLYPDRSSWLRLEGDLQPSDVTSEGNVAYVLRDSRNPDLAVTILAPGPMPTGHVEVTGHPLGGVRAPGTFEAFYADPSTEPARHDPWLLIALPALLGLLLLLGERIGYPVIRGESQKVPLAAAPLRPGEEVAARWNGQVGSEDLPLGEARACSVAVDDEGEVALLRIRDEGGTRHVAVRRTTPKVIGRVCRTNGFRPGIEVHGTGSDIVFEFDSAADRDRLAASVV
jgi:hypothetical protein